MQLDTDFVERLEDLRKAAKRADREDALKVQALRRLMSSSDWPVYLELLSARLQPFADELLRPAGGLDGMVAHEFVKGAMFGLTLARTLPTVIVESLASAALTDESYDD